MFFYLIYDEVGNVQEYTKSKTKIIHKDFVEVEESIYRKALNDLGFEYETLESKVDKLIEEGLISMEYSNELDYRLASLELNL